MCLWLYQCRESGMWPHVTRYTGATLPTLTSNISGNGGWGTVDGLAIRQLNQQQALCKGSTSERKTSLLEWQGSQKNHQPFKLMFLIDKTSSNFFILR